jgi:Fe/S biogenesis protein NfuA
MLEITDVARQKLLELWAEKKHTTIGLLIGIAGRGPNGFEYVLRFLTEDEESDHDLVTEIDDLPILVDRESADNLKGSTIDFLAMANGFNIDNPNPVWVWSDPLEQAVQNVLTNQINPSVASHGGRVQLLEVKDHVAYIELGGGCVGCGLVDVTLKQGIEVAIMAAVPEIKAIVDTTDHASGTNPYYQESKGGPHHQPAKGGPAPSSPFG